MLRALLISVCLICSATSANPVINEDYKLLASDGASDDQFGWSVSISSDGTTAIVGAHYNADSGGSSGSAYIYELVKGVWEETKFLASDGASSDHFGYSVSISSDGSTAIVGAHSDDDNGNDSGSAYIYSLVKGIWQETKLLASDGANGHEFGESVSISSDGSTAIVGARYAGSAYIYQFDGSTWVENKLTASSDYFGDSVSVDGDTAIVGAYGDDDNGSNSGSAYIYQFDGSAWVEEVKLLASDGASGDYFGESVSISSDGSTAIVGANGVDDNGSDSGSAYIYELVGGVWEETKLFASDAASIDYFGRSVSISSDGTTALVGASHDDDNDSNSGSAYIYDLVKGVWQETKLLASDGANGDEFGYSVSISSDGSTTLVGAHYDDDNGSDSGSAYIFTREDEDGDGVYDGIDNCDLYNPDQADCNGNGIGDVCDLFDQTSIDCDQNDVPDECQPDCDEDGTIDGCDDEPDFDNDGIPDNCEPDCNNNNIPDDFEIENGWTPDCDGNGIPDSCDIENDSSLDCNEDDVIDSCQWAEDPSLDCNENGIFDGCDIEDGTSEDCNANGVPDECDIANETSTDLNANSIPDDCEIDCQPNGIPDLWEIKTGQISDCNLNKIPDDCDITDGTSVDIDSNGIPDECEPDCNNNGLPDSWDIELGNETDCDGNDIPDSCEVLGQWCEFDCNVNGVPDACDIAGGVSEDFNANGVPDECECFVDIDGDGVVAIGDLLEVIGHYGSGGPIGDFDSDGIVDIADILLLLYYWGPCPEVECTPRTQWRVEDGGNDHWYKVISMNYTWEQGSNYAASVGGYLATVTSSEENAFISPQISSTGAAWLGGYQDLSAGDYSEPGGGWRWVTGEPWKYTSWNTNEPNDGGALENYLQAFSNGLWNDQYANAVMHIVVEWSAD